MSFGDDDPPTAVIGVGASAGGVEALTGLMRALPSDLPASVLVVLHVPSSGTSVLATILDRAGPLPAVAASSGERLRRGVVYVAPPNRHLAVRDGLIELLAGPRENGHRPAIDPLLVSIAAYGDTAVGVILSGTRDDGTRGMLAIKQAGGTTLVQDPAEALFDGMVRNVQRYVKIDGVLGIAELGGALSALSRSRAGNGNNGRLDEPEMQHGSSPQDDRSATRYTCPDCGGALWRHESGDAKTFRCSVGHAYSPASFDGEQGHQVESALWAAARLLGDRQTLLEEMARNAAAKGHDSSAGVFLTQAQEVASAANTIRGLIESGRLALGAVGDDVAAA
jgi:two-component system, chemotaxis family, protein-glutamate methylesterase/glutaminase